jgi:DNA-binding transcriptional regulator YiaG
MRASELETAAATRARLASGDARRAREGAGVSAAEVARVIRVSRASVCDWETGRKVPTDEHALAYGRLLARLAPGTKGAAA